MAKTIRFSYNGKDYTLEYTRRAVRVVNERGFRPDELRNNTIVMVPLLFSGAFFAHHRNVPEKEINEIWEQMQNKEDLLTALGEMYSQPTEALMDDSQGNVSWSVQ